jgi:hypothetical protein
MCICQGVRPACVYDLHAVVCDVEATLYTTHQPLSASRSWRQGAPSRLHEEEPVPAAFTLSAECQGRSVALACCWTRRTPPGPPCHQAAHPQPLLVVVVHLSPEHPRPWAHELALFGAVPSLSRTRSAGCRHCLAARESPHHHTELCTGWPLRWSSSCRHRRSFPHMKAKPMTDHNAKLHQLCPSRCRLQVSGRCTTSLSPDTPQRTCSF